MSPVLALLLFLAEPPTSLSPEAAEHNTRAMQHYDAGQYAPAVDEFYAAYTAMPDARRDREGRGLLLGSMRGTLLDLTTRPTSQRHCAGCNPSSKSTSTPSQPHIPTTRTCWRSAALAPATKKCPSNSQ